MRTLAGVVLLLILAAGRSGAQTPLLDQELRAAAALQGRVQASSGVADPGLQVRSLRLALPATTARRQHALGETLLLIGGGAVVVGAISGGGGGTVLIVGGIACAGYGVYLLQL